MKVFAVVFEYEELEFHSGVVSLHATRAGAEAYALALTAERKEREVVDDESSAYRVEEMEVKP